MGLVSDQAHKVYDDLCHKSAEKMRQICKAKEDSEVFAKVKAWAVVEGVKLNKKDNLRAEEEQ